MVVYEFEMLERFLENQEYFDHYPSKYLMMAQVHCLVMFAMKIILRAVQKTTITFKYVSTVIEGDVGKNAMKLASKFAKDLLEENSVDYLSDKDIVASTNVMFNSKKTFVEELKEYTDQNSSYFVSKDASGLKRTCSDPFNIDDAVEISDTYIDSLWTAIRSRLSYTDISESAAA